MCNCQGNLIKGNLAAVFLSPSNLRNLLSPRSFNDDFFQVISPPPSFTYTSIIVDLLTASFFLILLLLLFCFSTLRCRARLLFNLYILNTYSNSPSFIASSLDCVVFYLNYCNENNDYNKLNEINKLYLCLNSLTDMDDGLFIKSTFIQQTDPKGQRHWYQFE